MTTFHIQDFYSKWFESESTLLLLENPEFFSQKAMENYLYQVINYPLKEYIYYIIENPITNEITSKDITQLSSIEDCTTNMCKMMLLNGNCGLTLPQIASGLHADKNYKDNLVALTKYGENQVKFSISLLRDPFYSKVISSMCQQETNLIDFMTILSESTQKRRSSSCMKLIDIFIHQCRVESINIHPITL